VNPSANLILASLSKEIFCALPPHLQNIEFKHGEVLTETGTQIKDVYFPDAGIISLVVELSVGEMVETAMVGRDGVVNAACALDGKVSLNKAIVQLAGVGSVISAEHMTTIADQHRHFRARLIRHEQVLFA
jgi:hypothetical protein